MPRCQAVTMIPLLVIPVAAAIPAAAAIPEMAILVTTIPLAIPVLETRAAEMVNRPASQ